MGTAKRERQKANRQSKLEAALAAQQKAKRNRQWLLVGGAIAAVAAIFLLVSILSGDDTKVDTAASSSPSTVATAPTTTEPVQQAAFAYGTGECAPAEGATPTKKFTAAPKLCIDPAKTYVAAMDTSAGMIKIQLDTQRTPGTTNNFVTLARYKYYDSSKLFRTDPSIGIIQGGGQTNSDTPGYEIPDEGGKFAYQVGDFVMARTGAPNSAGAQFFFAVTDKVKALDGQGTYVTFGKVVEGQDVLDKILASHKVDPASDLGGGPDPEVTVKAITITES